MKRSLFTRRIWRLLSTPHIRSPVPSRLACYDFLPFIGTRFVPRAALPTLLDGAPAGLVRYSSVLHETTPILTRPERRYKMHFRQKEGRVH